MTKMTKKEFVKAIMDKRTVVKENKMSVKCMMDFMRHQKDTNMMNEHLHVEEIESGETYKELSLEGFDEREDYSGRKELESLDEHHHDKGLECYEEERETKRLPLIN